MLFIVYRHNHASSQSSAREIRCCRRKIRCALEKRDREVTSFQDLASEFGVRRSTLNGWSKGRKSWQRAREEEQTLSTAGENELEKWTQKIGSRGFPPRLDIFKAMAQDLAGKNAEQMGDSKHAKPGCKSCPTVTSKFPRSLDPIWTVNVHRQVVLDLLSTISISSGRSQGVRLPARKNLRARSANLSASICEVNEPDRSERPVRLSEFLGLACSANLSASICEVNEPDRSL